MTEQQKTKQAKNNAQGVTRSALRMADDYRKRLEDANSTKAELSDLVETLTTQNCYLKDRLSEFEMLRDDRDNLLAQATYWRGKAITSLDEIAELQIHLAPAKPTR